VPQGITEVLRERASRKLQPTADAVRRKVGAGIRASALKIFGNWAGALRVAAQTSKSR
jgi:hypothetical protein